MKVRFFILVIFHVFASPDHIHAPILISRVPSEPLEFSEFSSTHARQLKVDFTRDYAQLVETRFN